MRAEVAHLNGAPVVQGELVEGHDEMLLQRQLGRRLVVPGHQTESCVGLDLRVGNVDPSAGIGHVDAVAVVVTDAAPSDVDVAGTVHDLDTGPFIAADQFNKKKNSITDKKFKVR